MYPFEFPLLLYCKLYNINGIYVDIGWNLLLKGEMTCLVRKMGSPWSHFQMDGMAKMDSMLWDSYSMACLVHQLKQRKLLKICLESWGHTCIRVSLSTCMWELKDATISVKKKKEEWLSFLGPFSWHIVISNIFIIH